MRLHGIVDRGDTVVVTEHNLTVVAQADAVIDLGPDGRKNGGEILFTGAPSDLITAQESRTGQHLRRAVA